MDFLFIQFAHMRYNLPSLCANAQSTLDTQRKVSEDPKYQGYIPKILVSCGLSNLLHFYCIHSMVAQIISKFDTLSIFVHLSRIRIYPKDFGFLLHISVYKYQGSRIYPKDFGFLRIVQSLAYYRIQVSRFPHICLHCGILVSRALRSFPHTVGCYTLVLQQEEAMLLTLGRL